MLNKYIKRKIRNFSVNFNTPSSLYRYFPLNYFRYLRHKKLIPLQHVASYEVLVKFKKILNNISVDFYLASGALLGAYRNNKFAGRPRDIDLFIKAEDLTEIFKNHKLLFSNGFKIDKLKINKGIVNIQPPMGCPISLMPCKINSDGLYKRVKLNLEEIIKFKINATISKIPREKEWNKSHLGMSLNLLENNKILLYKTFFLIPKNTKEYLQNKYGKNWRIPIN